MLSEPRKINSLWIYRQQNWERNCNISMGIGWVLQKCNTITTAGSGLNSIRTNYWYVVVERQDVNHTQYPGTSVSCCRKVRRSLAVSLETGGAKWSYFADCISGFILCVCFTREREKNRAWILWNWQTQGAKVRANITLLLWMARRFGQEVNHLEHNVCLCI